MLQTHVQADVHRDTSTNVGETQQVERTGREQWLHVAVNTNTYTHINPMTSSTASDYVVVCYVFIVRTRNKSVLYTKDTFMKDFMRT